ncbi:RabGAP/TBC, partial [Coniochaeta ligniaria NRRL 30616]
MTPKKSNSFRSKERPAARISPFRDDTGLIAFRYEQTKQAKPPIPLPPPRSPLRSFRPCSTVTSDSDPVVISSPLVAPPQEEHPLFRTQLTRSNEWKRDSGAPTSSSVTIHGDLDEEYVYHKLGDEPYPIRPLFAVDEKALKVVPRISPSTLPPLYTLPRRAPTPPELPAIPSQPDIILVPGLESTCTSPTDLKPDGRMFGKSLSLSSSSGPPKRLRKKNISVSVDASNKGPKSPTAGVVPPPRLHQTKPSASDASRGSISSSFQQDEKAFMPLTTEIPSDSLLSEDLFEQLEFSKRGSIMFGAKRSPIGSSPSPMQKPTATHDSHCDSAARAPGRDGASSAVPSIRVLAPDVERDSQKVRSLYDSTESIDWNDGGRVSTLVELPQAAVDDPSSRGEQNDPYGALPPPRTHIPGSGTPRSASSLSQPPDRPPRGEFELAGGLEDWEDVSGADVDRYGFITPRKAPPRPESPDTTSDDTHLSPTKRRGILGLRPSSSYTSSPLALARRPTKKVSARSLNTQNTDSSAVSRRSARNVVRHATNRLPHNRARRWMDEAGDMLNLSPGLDDIQEEELTGKLAEAAKRKEWERAEKWRKMAKVTKKGKDGEGMEFEFDAKNQKLIDRTWKGIPDMWRAAAWYSFLATSARNSGGQEEDQDLFSEFHRLQDEPSPDDVQIDLDVPRTINRHIMFRKRYKGGQRLLFRVLHAISLYFPDTGYVQGMASLAATLLCYFDEEKTFVMLVRMWRYRGLERLYQPGFEGLMTTLGDFKKHWLEGKDVARKLKDLDIDPTAYGTRWYLTLFNLSIPFPAQLRVWDVFMLLGECSPEPSSPTSAGPSEGKGTASPSLRGLDILHATSAALIDALQEVLLDADFENAMKALTSWVPVKDEEMLMKVTRAEWKQHQSKK